MVFKQQFVLIKIQIVGGSLLSIRNDISAKVVSTDDRLIESFYVELNFRKKNMAVGLFLQP